MRTLAKSSLVVVAVVGWVLMSAQTAQADFNPLEAACGGNRADTTVCQQEDETGDQSLYDVFATVVDTILIIAGLVAVIMIIVGGFRYVTSGGDQSATAAAKSTVLYAVVGLIIAIASFAIVNFVLVKL